MGIDEHGWAKLSRQSDDIATLQVCTRDTGQVHGHTAPRLRNIDFIFVRLQATDARPQALRQDFNLLSDFEVAVKQSSGDDSAKARQCKNPINR